MGANKTGVDLGKLALVLDRIRNDVCDGSDGDNSALYRAISVLSDVSSHLKGIPYHADFEFDINEGRKRKGV